DVRVQASDGPDAGKFALSDASGAYNISLRTGAVTISALKDGYQQKDIAITLTAATTLDILIRQVCDQWPQEASEELAKLSMPDGLCFVRVTTPAVYSFYSAVARTVFVRAEDLSNPNTVRHELGHAHQHRVILDAGLPDP